jgi:hypothetical protein
MRVTLSFGDICLLAIAIAVWCIFVWGIDIVG